MNAWKTMPIRRRMAFSSSPGSVMSSPVEQDAPVVDRLEQVDAAQQRRLARARGPDEAHDLVLVDGEVDLGEHVVRRRTTSTPPSSAQLAGHRVMPAGRR